jgi:hypothetical protein
MAKRKDIVCQGGNLMGEENQGNANNELSMEELNDVVEKLCHSKAEEFHLLGYENVTGQEIWQCVSSRYKKEMPMLHAVVNDVLSLKVTQFMNWLTMQAYKG